MNSNNRSPLVATPPSVSEGELVTHPLIVLPPEAVIRTRITFTATSVSAIRNTSDKENIALKIYSPDKEVIPHLLIVV